MNTALAFSGGKDSWACLWLNKDRLSDMYVIWVNTGKNFPEVLKSINKAKEMCPHWIEVTSDRDAQNNREGIPSQIVPIDWTPLGQKMTSAKPVSIQSYLGCCYENISGPLNAEINRLGVSEVILGKRNSDKHKTPIHDGAVVDGITYRQPVESWETSDVLEFCARHMEIPEHFRFAHSSMDCFDCTAYQNEISDQISYMREMHPREYAIYEQRRNALNSALAQAMGEMN